MARTMARVRTIFTGVAGAPAYSNLFFDSNTVDAGVSQTAVFDMWQALTNLIRSGTVVTMDNPISIIDDATGQVVDETNGDGGTFTATDAGDPLPPATNGLIRFTTDAFYAGRRLRGRCFIPYPTEAANTGGVPNSGYTGAVSDAFDAMNGSGGANGALLVYSPTNHASNYVTGMSVWNQWAVLRSRRD